MWTDSPAAGPVFYVHNGCHEMEWAMDLPIGLLVCCAISNEEDGNSTVDAVIG